MRIYYETQYKLIEGSSWLRFMDKHETQAAAIESAKASRNEEIQTRVVKVTVETLDTFDSLPGKPSKAHVIPGLGIVKLQRSNA